MDMGFSRKGRARDQRRSQADQLGSLLAEIAARQSVTPTARAHTGDSSGEVRRCAKAAALAIFAPESRAPADVGAGRAFNPEIADTMQTPRKPL